MKTNLHTLQKPAPVSHTMVQSQTSGSSKGVNSHDGSEQPDGNGHHADLRKALAADDVGLAGRGGDLGRGVAVERGEAVGGVRVAREDDHDDAAEGDGEGEEVVQQGAGGRELLEAEGAVDAGGDDPRVVEDGDGGLRC